MNVFYLYCDDEKVMYTRYKPSVGDVIKNDDTGILYKVLSIVGKRCKCEVTNHSFVIVPPGTVIL